MNLRPSINLLGAIAAAALLLPGCDSEEIRSYTAPPDPPHDEVDFFALAEGRPGTPHQAEGQVTWDVPANWVESDAPPPLLAAWTADAGDEVRITVSRLAGEGGGTLPNINRWRGQLGLAPVTRIEDQPMIPIDIDGNPAAVVDLVGDTSRTAAVLYPRVDQNATWFFKMTGSPSAVGDQLEAFTTFARSVRFEESEPSSDTP